MSHCHANTCITSATSVQIYTLPSLLSKKEESKYSDLCYSWFNSKDYIY